MRCFLAAFAIASLTGPPLTAAQALGQSIEPGIHVVVNATTFDGESNTDFGYRGSFGAGLSLGIPIRNDVLFQPEIRYAAKGAKSDEATLEGVSGTLKVKSVVSYVEVPLLIVYRLDRGGSMRPRVFAGPYLARKLDATIEWEPSTGGPRQSDTDDSVVDSDFGIVAGLGVELDVAGEAVLLGGRATIGLSDVRDRPDAPLRNTGFELFFGMLLR